MNLPVVSLGETNVRPTAMLWRNMAAMATEEMLRANPIDGVCCSEGVTRRSGAADGSGIVDFRRCAAGRPMLSGTSAGCRWVRHRRMETVGGSACRNAVAEDFLRSESSMIRSRGHCNTMGTASTMALVAEALGTRCRRRGNSAADSRLLQAAHETGGLVISMVRDGRRPASS